MTDKPNKLELIDKGIQLLDDALSHFTEIQDCQQSDAVARIIHGLIAVAQIAKIIK